MNSPRRSQGAPHHAFIESLTTQLAVVADPTRARKQQAYMKSSLPYYGIAMPDVRRITKAAIRTHDITDAAQLKATVRTLWDSVTYREQWYAALMLCGAPRYAKYRTMEFLDLYEHVIVTGAWWDVVDDAATHLVGPLLRDQRPHMTSVITEWANGEDLWLRRTAIICQVGAGTATDNALLRTVIEANLGRPEFFLRNAIGWALRDYARTAPVWVMAYVGDHDQLSGLSKR
ncbi:MAG: DNA alkylation repair protein, partial [Candidatus Nanopelagicales bacterium]